MMLAAIGQFFEPLSGYSPMKGLGCKVYFYEIKM